MRYRALGRRFVVVFVAIRFAAAFLAVVVCLCGVDPTLLTKHCWQRRPRAALSSFVTSIVPEMICPQRVVVA
jgi:hypothetical protein